MSFGGGTNRDATGASTGGYDVLGTGVVGDPTRNGRALQSISPMDSDDDSYVAAIQANVDAQLAQQAAARQQQAAQQQAAQRMQDPVIQMQQQEQARKDREQAVKEQQANIDSQIKMREQARKEAESQTKALTEQQKLDLDREELYLQFQIDSDKLANTDDVERAKLRLQEIQNIRNIL